MQLLKGLVFPRPRLAVSRIQLSSRFDSLSLKGVVKALTFLIETPPTLLCNSPLTCSSIYLDHCAKRWLFIATEFPGVALLLSGLQWKKKGDFQEIGFGQPEAW